MITDGVVKDNSRALFYHLFVSKSELKARRTHFNDKNGRFPFKTEEMAQHFHSSFSYSKFELL